LSVRLVMPFPKEVNPYPTIKAGTTYTEGFLEKMWFTFFTDLTVSIKKAVESVCEEKEERVNRQNMLDNSRLFNLVIID